MSSKNFNLFKDFQSDQIRTSSRKLFTAHYACSNSDLNMTPVTGTTNGFIFQIINSLIESWGVRLTCLTVSVPFSAGKFFHRWKDTKEDTDGKIPRSSFTTIIEPLVFL